MYKILSRSILLAGVSTLAAIATASAQDESSGEEDSEFLGTITLGESKRAVQTDTATPVTVIDQEEADDRQASTIAELIDSVPGVALVNGSTPSGSGINIRGFGANGTYGTDQKVAIIVDGATTGSEEIYRVGNQLFTDPYLYKSVEVIRGTVGSFEYGSGIVGGTVRLETKDAADFTGGDPGLKAGGTLGAASNGDGFNTSLIAARQPTENIELLANYAYREQSLQKDGDGNEIGNSAFELPSLLLKGRYSFGTAHAITASYTQSEAADRDVPYDTFETTGGSFGNVDRDTKTQTASLAYNFNPLDNDLVNIDASLAYANQEIDQTCLPASAPFGCFAVVDADHQYETTTATLKNTAFADTGIFSHELRTGLQLIRKERLDANSAPGGTDDRVAVFVVDQIDFLEGWTFTPALRWETSEIDGETESYQNDAVMGGASLRYQFRNGLALFGSLAHTESLPIIDDLGTPLYMEQPEVADTAEYGFSYDRIGLFGEGNAAAFKVNYYETALSDITSYSGVTDVDQTGFEIEASFAAAIGFYTDINANIVNGQETRSNGQHLDWRNTPANNYRITVGQRFSNFADVSFETVSNLDTERSNLTGGAAVYDETEGFTIYNLRLTLRPQNGILEGTQFRISAENLSDELYTPFLATRAATGRNLKVAVSRMF
ncbi:TonB-dependent receptor [Parvularcula flava]|nr:TonB-dependent receptor [Aquisalinus luteolus]NHK27142.1 TonB-dependent receptor [Aquisalinus luteolus]